MSEERKVIRVGRRRHPEEAPPGGRERAEAPQRRETDQGGPTPPSFSGLGGGDTGGSGGLGGGGMPQIPLPSFGKGKTSCLGLVALAVIVICVFLVIQYMGSQNTG